MTAPLTQAERSAAFRQRRDARTQKLKKTLALIAEGHPEAVRLAREALQ